MSPEAAARGLLSKVRDGDRILLDVREKRLELLVDADELSRREPAVPDLSKNRHGFGRELFTMMRRNVGSAETGATIFDAVGEERA